VADYLDVFNESEVSYAFAKKSILRENGSFMVGALARLNLKFDCLQPATQALARTVGAPVPSDNPFHNHLAQALEVVDCIERCIQILHSQRFEDEDPLAMVQAGAGGAATEAPRGLLFHGYRINQRGTVEKATIVTPTSHNFQNMEKDLRQLVEQNPELDKDHLRLLCEQLVRAYDPCFSCSVH